MTRFSQEDSLAVETLLGVPVAKLENRPTRPFAEDAIDFLAVLSRELFRHADVRKYPDVVAFAYWCRRSSLLRMANEQSTFHKRVGRGVVFHIAPSNTPVNFAFSFAFGLLSGNSNVVRVSSKAFDQVDFIIEVAQPILSERAFRRIAATTSIIRYEVNDAITAALSLDCQARMLWGGDATISHLRSLPTSPRCVDVCFADRYSICVLSAKEVLSLNAEQLSALANDFSNDSYLFDQNACSSPHLVLWIGDSETITQSKRVFWDAVDSRLTSVGRHEVIQGVERFNHLCKAAIELDTIVSSAEYNDLHVRANLSRIPVGIDALAGRYGFFFEAESADLTPLRSTVTERYQTICYFGLEQADIVNFVVENGLLGIDRVVPVGQALQIGPIWDGYDLIATLSRIVADR